MCGHNRCSYSCQVGGAKRSALSTDLGLGGRSSAFDATTLPSISCSTRCMTTGSVMLAFQEQGLVTIVLSQRTGTQNRILAGCGWREGAGIDTSDRRMIPNFNKPAGFDCIVTVGDSAEEGGYVLIDPAQDGKSLTLFIQSPITAENDSPRKATGYNLTLGKEDRTFALTRIDSKACQSFKAVTE